MSLGGQIWTLEAPGGGRTDERTNGRTDRNSPCVLQDFVPFGAAAQKNRQQLAKEQAPKLSLWSQDRVGNTFRHRAALETCVSVINITENKGRPKEA